MPKIYVPVKRKTVLTPENKGANWWADEMKLKAVTVYQATGSMKETAAILGIPVNTLYQWKERAGWWDEVTAELQESENIKSANKVKGVVDKALDLLEDRVKNGDLTFDSKTGRIKRIPLKAKDLTTISNTMIDRKLILSRQTPKHNKEQDKASLEGKLDKLAEAFIKFASGKAKDQIYQGEYNTITDVQPI